MECVFNPQTILKMFWGLHTLIRKWLTVAVFPKNEHVDYFGSFSFFFPVSHPLFLWLKPNVHTGWTWFIPRLLSLAPPHNGLAWSPFHEMTCWAGFSWQLYNQNKISMLFLVSNGYRDWKMWKYQISVLGSHSNPFTLNRPQTESDVHFHE